MFSLHQPPPRARHRPRLYRTTLKIGRKHKSHRQQLQSSKPWRNSEKGRKGKDKGRGRARHGKMGQEESHVVDDDTPTRTLEARTIEALAKYIKDGKARNVVVMVCHVGSIGGYSHVLTDLRQEQESALRPEYPTLDRQTRDSMRTSPVSTFHMQKPSLILATSGRTHCRSTPLRRSFTLENTGQQSRIRS